jgi:hypothetical protein
MNTKSEVWSASEQSDPILSQRPHFGRVKSHYDKYKNGNNKEGLEGDTPLFDFSCTASSRDGALCEIV